MGDSGFFSDQEVVWVAEAHRCLEEGPDLFFPANKNGVTYYFWVATGNIEIGDRQCRTNPIPVPLKEFSSHNFKILGVCGF
ncbi:hypothetical protein Taro_033908 [Colocasia esculenta]|uniref:Uncharacterized protein n=1 Tax=Colocasia esculenta TaxID=4460 RepID=A0A843VZ83_COLES|nr:hypothetical protein [Colocasia esculenta]